MGPACLTFGYFQQAHSNGFTRYGRIYCRQKLCRRAAIRAWEGESTDGCLGHSSGISHSSCSDFGSYWHGMMYDLRSDNQEIWARDCRSWKSHIVLSHYGRRDHCYWCHWWTQILWFRLMLLVLGSEMQTGKNKLSYWAWNKPPMTAPYVKNFQDRQRMLYFSHSQDVSQFTRVMHKIIPFKLFDMLLFKSLEAQ